MGGFPCCCSTFDPCWCTLCNQAAGNTVCPDEYDITLSGHSDYTSLYFPYNQCDECDNLDGTFTVQKESMVGQVCRWVYEDTSSSNTGTGLNCQYMLGGGGGSWHTLGLRISKITLSLYKSYHSWSQGKDTWQVDVSYQRSGALLNSWSEEYGSGYGFRWISSSPSAYGTPADCDLQTSPSLSLYWQGEGTKCDVDSLSVSVENAS